MWAPNLNDASPELSECWNLQRQQLTLSDSRAKKLTWALEYHTLILFFLKGTIMK